VFKNTHLIHAEQVHFNFHLNELCGFFLIFIPP